MSNFRPIDLHQLSINPFQAIADQWMLITAEKPVDGQPKANTMTASWGGLGHLWGKDVAFAFIRPQRYTKQFDYQSAVLLMVLFTLVVSILPFYLLKRKRRQRRGE